MKIIWPDTCVIFTCDLGLDPYTTEVYEAIFSLYLAGNRKCRYAHIWRVMNGKDATRSLTPRQKENIGESVKKLREMGALTGMEVEK